jgi:uncharacterized protein (UPF0332 family)
MAMARDRARTARAALASGSPSSATSLAYYAMLYAARAALSEEDRNARTHRGTWQLFRATFVDTRRFDGELAAAAQETQALREGADYDARRVSADEAERMCALAERFLSAIDDLVD